MSTAELIFFLMMYFFVPDMEYTLHLMYGTETYAKDWVAMANQDGTPRYILLNYTDAEITDRERDTSVLRDRGEVQFYLYTNKNPGVVELLKTPWYYSSFYDFSARMYILVPGWLQDLQSEFPQTVKDAILKNRDVNIVVMDWYSMQNFNYLTTAYRTYEAGKILKDFIANIQMTYGPYGLKVSSMYIIGNCLGAHVAGLAGKQLIRDNLTIPRITGLDPTAPYFERPKLYEGISKNSAKFVDIIHTSMGVLGIEKPAGVSDFYPNGGVVFQPVCCPKRTPGLPGACEHHCGYYYYAHSFKTDYEAVKCDTYVNYKARVCDMDEIQNMGERVDDWSHGLYFVDIYPENKGSK